MDTNYEPTGKGIVTGKGVGDFDFLASEWKIRHKRLNKGTKDEWLSFDSGATIHRVLNGMGSIEELRKADGGDMGMAVRIWLPEQKKWADYWTSVGNGVVNAPQLGEFYAQEVNDGKHVYSRFIWSKITADSCQWEQALSGEGGKTWETNWIMEFERV